MEGDGFKEFVKKLDPRYVLPSRIYLKDNALLPLYHKTEDYIRKRIKMSNRIAFTTDGWSSLANDRYISLTCHFIHNETFKLETCILATNMYHL